MVSTTIATVLAKIAPPGESLDSSIALLAAQTAVPICETHRAAGAPAERAAWPERQHSGSPWKLANPLIGKRLATSWALSPFPTANFKAIPPVEQRLVADAHAKRDTGSEFSRQGCPPPAVLSCQRFERITLGAAPSHNPENYKNAAVPTL
jgi:hypothetical protein